MLDAVTKFTNYAARNGIKKAVLATAERFLSKQHYIKRTLSEAELERQRKHVFEAPLFFDIIVPAYNTDPDHFKAMVTSVINQTYPNFRLLIGDAGDRPLFSDGDRPSVSDGDRPFVSDGDRPLFLDGDRPLLLDGDRPLNKSDDINKVLEDSRIVYFKLSNNGGISENTNEILKRSSGDYIMLLDHDDFLEPDALFSFMEVLDNCRTGDRPLFSDGDRPSVSDGDRPLFSKGDRPRTSTDGDRPLYSKGDRPLYKVLFSDEDKCDSTGKEFYEPNFKPGYDMDLLMSNNYICHLTCVERELALKHGFRKAFDGAQDHDFLLRVCEDAGEDMICHIPKVLYHWRCHRESTAANPAAKMWAYDAGRACVEDFCRSKGWKAHVEHSEHLGFYTVVYDGDIFDIRKDIGAICGPVYKNGHIISGAMNEKGEVLYKGLVRGFSGYMQRAVQMQEVYAGDIRNMRVRPELSPLIENVSDNLERSKIIRNAGYKILYVP